MTAEIPSQRKRETSFAGRVPGNKPQGNRRRREATRPLIAQGIDPSGQRKEGKAAAEAERRKKENAFRVVATEWLGVYGPDLTEKHASNLAATLKMTSSPPLVINPSQSLCLWIFWMHTPETG